MHLGVVFYNSRDPSRLRETNRSTNASHLFLRFNSSCLSGFPCLHDCLDVAHALRYSGSMEATQSYPNLLSEKQAARRLGIARITLLRAREAGRIRFFRIGTRVLYCAKHLTDFLDACERNIPKPIRELKSHASRKENRVSSSRGSVGEGERSRPKSKTDSRKKEQASLPFAGSR